MDEGNSTGLIATIGSAITTIGIAGLAVWKAYTTFFEDKHAHGDAPDIDAVRGNLDRKQEQYINRIERENARLREQRDLWEARARRVDQVAYTLQRLVVAAYAAAGKSDADVPKIPLLEDELT